VTITLTKLIPWLVVAGGLYGFRDSLADAAKSVEDLAKSAGTSAEIGNIMVFLNNDSIVGGLPNADTFPDYLRKNGHSLFQGDPGADFWGTPYRLDRDDDTGRFAVRSAGPDLTFETPDDIVMHGRVEKQ
jgi:hypothetical protein